MPSKNLSSAAGSSRGYSAATEAVIVNATQQLRQGFNPSLIYLFGSYARGDYGSDSDLDFFVVVPSSAEPRFRRSQQAHRLLQGIKAPKDILVLTEAEWDRERRSGVSLSNLVEGEGILLYES